MSDINQRLNNLKLKDEKSSHSESEEEEEDKESQDMLFSKYKDKIELIQNSPAALTLLGMEGVKRITFEESEVSSHGVVIRTELYAVIVLDNTFKNREAIPAEIVGTKTIIEYETVIEVIFIP